MLTALAAGLLALVVVPVMAHACPSRDDPFYIKVVAKGDGATPDEGFLAAFDKLNDRVHVLADGLRLTPGRRIIVGKTDVTTRSIGEGVDRTTVTLTTWYMLDASAMSMESFSNSCVGTGAAGILAEYDMEKFDQ